MAQIKLYYFEGRNTGIAATSAKAARAKKKRGGDKIVAVRKPSSSERKSMKKGRWVTTRKDGKSKAKSKYGKGRGYGKAKEAMTRRDYGYMNEETQIELHLERETELFLCADNSSYDSEWMLYGYDADGTRTTVTYEVTDETPEDRSIVLLNRKTNEEFLIHWNVTVTKR